MSFKPPVFELCKADAGVTALLGSSPVRVYRFGEAPQGCQYPYVVWQIISGSPDNYLAGRPDSDDFSVQLDVWANTEQSAEQVAEAVRHAVELACYVTSYSTGKQPGTNKYRYTLGLDFIESR